MKLVQIATAFYVIGIIYILLKSFFYIDHYTIWDDIYFLWDKTKDALFLGTILYLIPGEHRWIVRPFFIFSIILVIWEIIIIPTRIDVQHPLMASIAISAIATGLIIVFITDMTKRIKQKP